MNVDESGERELKMGRGRGRGGKRGQRTAMNYSTTMMLLMIIASGSGGDSVPQNLRTLRLCSRSLSDALYLICQDRGFNEPFSYGHDETVELTDTPNPGLVQQCCHRPCSYQYLEQYCKPLPSSSSPSPVGIPVSLVPKSSSRREDVRTYGNEIGEGRSFRIVNLPYSSVREFMQINSESMEYTSTRAPRRKRRRKKVRGMTDISEKCNCHGQSVKGKHFQDQRIDWRSKMFSGKMKSVPKVGDFQVGTTSPELTDSILVFPFSFKSRPHLKRG